MLTKTLVVSAARKLCLSWTGTVSKPGVTQMTSWPGWASGTDLGDLGAGRLIRLWPCCAPAGHNNNRRLHGKTQHDIIFKDVVFGCPGGQGSLSGCFSWSWYEGTLCCLICAFHFGAFLRSFPALFQLRVVNATVLERKWALPLLTDDALVLKCLDFKT